MFTSAAAGFHLQCEAGFVTNRGMLVVSCLLLLSLSLPPLLCVEHSLRRASALLITPLHRHLFYQAGLGLVMLKDHCLLLQHLTETRKACTSADVQFANKQKCLCGNLVTHNSPRWEERHTKGCETGNERVQCNFGST